MNKKRMKSILLNEEGSGLVIVLMVLVVLSALGSTLGVVTIGSMQLSEHTQESNSAYYIAEAGANMAYEEFKAEVLSVYANTDSENVFFEELYNESGNKPAIQGVTYSEDYFQKNGSNQPMASIEVEKPHETGDQRTYTIKSTGTINGKTRVVEKPVVITWIPKNSSKVPTLPKNTVMMIKNKITFTNGEIEGDVYVDSDNKDIIELGWGTNFTHEKEFKYDLYTKHQEMNAEDIFKPAGEDLKNHYSVKPKYKNFGTDWQYFDKYEPNLPEADTDFENIQNLPDKKEIPIFKNSKKDVFTHNGNNRIKLDGDVYLVVNEIHSGWGVTSIEGAGTLTIIVREDMKISGGFNMDNDIDVEIIYLNAEKELTIGGGDDLIWGNIIAPYSTVNINGSAEIYGDIIAKETKVTGQGKVFGNIFTKKAEFSGSGHLHGSIISEEILINNAGGTIKLGEMSSVEDAPGPDNIEDLIITKPGTEQ